MDKCYLGLGLAAVLVLPGVTHAALESRLSGQAYYDTVLDITWLANAKLVLTNQFGLSLSTLEIDDTPNTVGSTGLITWTNANAWIGGMNTANYLGFNNWRLPTMIDTGAPGCVWSNNGGDCGYNVRTSSGSPPYPATVVYSEMASLFYDTLGNLAYYDTAGNPNQPGWGFSNTGPFSVVQGGYWSGLEYAPNTNLAWGFNFPTGDQVFDNKNVSGSAWAVHPGDVGIVPIPAAAWLLGSGLLGLIGLSRQRRR